VSTGHLERKPQAEPQKLNNEDTNARGARVATTIYENTKRVSYSTASQQNRQISPTVCLVIDTCSPGPIRRVMSLSACRRTQSQSSVGQLEQRSRVSPPWYVQLLTFTVVSFYFFIPPLVYLLKWPSRSIHVTGDGTIIVRYQSC